MTMASESGLLRSEINFEGAYIQNSLHGHWQNANEE